MSKEKKKENSSSQEEKERIESLASLDNPETEALSPEEEKDKKIKNLVSAVILLAGLFVGSLFVDVIQLVRGGGFSERALKNTDAFVSGGKTWVAYSEPIVKMQIINDDACGEPCKPDEIVLGIKQTIPTMVNEKIDVNSEQGKKIVSDFGIKTLPAFIFSKEIEKTELFSKIEQIMEKKSDAYLIKSSEAGLPVGKYIESPKIGDGDIKIGSDGAKVKIVEFTDFQCPYCKKLHEEVISKMLKEYGDKVQLVFKNYPLPSHTMAEPAALASECANEQGKFEAYADKLFANQETWGKLKDASGTFKSYASQLGLKSSDFSKCLDDKKYQEKVKATLDEGQDFGIQGTPALFIGDNFQNGLVKYEDVKKILDEKLAE